MTLSSAAQTFFTDASRNTSQGLSWLPETGFLALVTIKKDPREKNPFH